MVIQPDGAQTEWTYPKLIVPETSTVSTTHPMSLPPADDFGEVLKRDECYNWYGERLFGERLVRLLWVIPRVLVGVSRPLSSDEKLRAMVRPPSVTACSDH